MLVITHLGPGLEVNNNNGALRLQLASNQNNGSHLARTRSIPLAKPIANFYTIYFYFCFATKKHVRENELPAAPSGNAKALLAAWSAPRRPISNETKKIGGFRTPCAPGVEARLTVHYTLYTINREGGSEAATIPIL